MLDAQRVLPCFLITPTPLQPAQFSQAPQGRLSPVAVRGKFKGCCFSRTFLLAAVQFPVIGVDFLCHYQLLIDPASNRLVDTCSAQSFVTVTPATGSSLAAAAVVAPSCLAGLKLAPCDSGSSSQHATCGQESSLPSHSQASTCGLPPPVSTALPGVEAPYRSLRSALLAATCSYPAGISHLLLFSAVLNQINQIFILLWTTRQHYILNMVISKAFDDQVLCTVSLKVPKHEIFDSVFFYFKRTHLVP